jgi:uncharacterized protein (UPF0332 family)
VSQPTDVQDQIHKILEKARTELALARLALENEFFDGASSRAYYAVFHAIKALLLSRQLSVSKHSAVLSAFHRDFIRTKILPEPFGKIADRLFNDRLLGDYSYDREISKSQAKADVEAAHQLEKAIEDYLSK